MNDIAALKADFEKHNTIAALKADFEQHKAECERLSERIAALEEEWPKTNKRYWLVDDGGSVVESTWTDYSLDHARLACGNCHRTEAEAQKRAALQKTLVVEAPPFKEGDVCWTWGLPGRPTPWVWSGASTGYALWHAGCLKAKKEDLVGTEPWVVK